METKFEIIDFHTHPFSTAKENICTHKNYCNMTLENTPDFLRQIGISKICGSVIERCECTWENIKALNDSALRLRDIYGDFYIPGFHVHPNFVKESCDEIKRMASNGVKLIGELVPYIHGWSDYSCNAFSAIIDEATSYGMIINFHSGGEDNMDNMVLNHPDTIFVAAHPGEYREFMRHLNRMTLSKNYYLDLSGTGIFRHGVLRHAIDEFGADRFLFGSDFPACNPAMFVGGVLHDSLITDSEKELILAKNAKRLLSLN